MEKVFLTGADGFIGSHLSPYLISKGYQVNAGIRGKEKLQHIPSGAIPVITGDLDSSPDWENMVKDAQVVIHLAAKVHALNEHGRDATAQYQLINVEVSKKLAKACVRQGVRKFIFISSVKAVGDFTEPGEMFSETTPCAPQDAYGRSKRDAELVLLQIAKESGLEVVILRIPLVYGPGVKANFLRLMHLADRGFPLPIASIKNERSLLYIRNLLSAIFFSITHAGAAGEIFLLSDDQDVSTPELVRFLSESLERPERLIAFPVAGLIIAGKLLNRASTVDRLINSLKVDITKIKRKLGWAPPYNIEEGLKETAKWYRNANL